jgi:lipopolysaccharide/colanic/teichoic acid biosynthesis glycosyltransferase
VGNGWYTPVKRIADVVMAASLLLLLSPVLAFIGTAVALTSPGPVLYRQVRCGRSGRRFRMAKFRTMRIDADREGAAVTTAGDPRVTPLGRILRKAKLDELPQLWNVLVGDMSIVGPRPQVPLYVRHHYPDPERRIVLAVRPGITGRTQVWCRHEEEMLAAQKDPDAYYKYTLLPKKIASDVAYVRSATPAQDLKLAAATALACLSLRPKGLAPEPRVSTDGRRLEVRDTRTVAAK